MVTLGQRLKAEREKRGLTIEKLAIETRDPCTLLRGD